jgi:hypothetical protein
MPKTPADIRSLCRAFTNETVQIVAGIARANETPPAVRVQAISLLWERGWGKAPQAVTVDGEASIKVVIRHILEGADGEAIDAEPAALLNGSKVIDGSTVSADEACNDTDDER